MTGLDGVTLAGVGTGHLTAIGPPAEGVEAGLRSGRPAVQLRVPFTVNRAISA